MANLKSLSAALIVPTLLVSNPVVAVASAPTSSTGVEKSDLSLAYDCTRERCCSWVWNGLGWDYKCSD